MRWPHFPSQCVLCQLWPSQRICSACKAVLVQPPRCSLCALPHDAQAACPPPFSQYGVLPWVGVHASLTYQEPLADLIQRLKFQGELSLIHALVDCMADCPPPWLQQVQDAVIVPIPASARSLQARGFNQSAELARQLKSRLRLNGPIRHALARADTSLQQSRLNREQRWSNMTQAFMPAAHAAHTSAQSPPASCLLVDDIMTTGATLLTAAQCLKQLGHSLIHVWVLARTPSPHDAPL